MTMRLDASSADFEARFRALLAMKREVSDDVDRAVKDIIENHLVDIENFFFPIPQAAILPGVTVPDPVAVPTNTSRRPSADLPIAAARWRTN